MHDSLNFNFTPAASTYETPLPERTAGARDNTVWDVAVAGGGVAGCAAAVAAARSGARTVIIEKAARFGGLATSGLVNFFVPMCDGSGHQVIFGEAEEFLRRAVQYGFGGTPGWEHGVYTGPLDRGGRPPRYVTRFSADIFSLVLCDLLAAEGVAIRFDSRVTGAAMDGGRIMALAVADKSGTSALRAKMFVDATGDGDVLALAGVPTVRRGNYDTYYGWQATLESCRAAADAGDIGALTRGVSGGNADLYGGAQTPGVPLWDGADGGSVSRYLVSNQRRMLETLRADKRRSRDVIALPEVPQLRTTRRLDGDYTLKNEDEGRHFEDSVGVVNDFDRRGRLFEVPYRCLVRKGWPNLITAGRSASGTGYAWDVLRVIPPAIITGQAAGTSAALCADYGEDLTSPDPGLLRECLRRGGVRLACDRII